MLVHNPTERCYFYQLKCLNLVYEKNVFAINIIALHKRIIW
jgi:hypothetical protein